MEASSINGALGATPAQVRIINGALGATPAQVRIIPRGF